MDNVIDVVTSVLRVVSFIGRLCDAILGALGGDCGEAQK